MYGFLFAGKDTCNQICQLCLNLGDRDFNLGQVCKELLEEGKLCDVVTSETLLIRMVQLHKEQVAQIGALLQRDYRLLCNRFMLDLDYVEALALPSYNPLHLILLFHLGSHKLLSSKHVGKVFW